MTSRSLMFSLLLPCVPAIACGLAQADESAPTPASSMLETCSSSYQIVGAVYDGEETESVSGMVFSEGDPFELCTFESPNQTITFGFNGVSTDPVSGCTYTLTRTFKNSSVQVGSSEVLSVADPLIHYSVRATPFASDPDCSGLPAIDVDPKVQVSWGKTSSPTTVVGP